MSESSNSSRPTTQRKRQLSATATASPPTSPALENSNDYDIGQQKSSMLETLSTVACQLRERVHWGEKKKSDGEDDKDAPVGANPYELLKALRSSSSIFATSKDNISTGSAVVPEVFLPRSFKGIARSVSNKSPTISSTASLTSGASSEKASISSTRSISFENIDDEKDNSNTSAKTADHEATAAQDIEEIPETDGNADHLQVETKDVRNKRMRLLRVVVRSIYERCYDQLLHATNNHSVEAMMEDFLRAARPDIATKIKYWDRTSLMKSLATGEDINNYRSSLCSPNPLGLPNQVELTGLQIDGLRKLLHHVFKMMPDSIFVQHGNVKFIDEEEEKGRAVIKAVGAFTLMGTAVMHTSLRDLHHCMPFIAAQHPMFHDPLTNCPTVTGSLVTGISSLLSNIPLSITVDVGLEVGVYVIVHFDKHCNKMLRMEFHYFVEKSKPFSGLPY